MNYDINETYYPSYNGYFAAINYFLTGYVVISFLVVLLIRKTRRGFYDAIRFEYYSLRK